MKILNKLAQLTILFIVLYSLIVASKGIEHMLRKPEIKTVYKDIIRDVEVPCICNIEDVPVPYYE